MIEATELSKNYGMNWGLKSASFSIQSNEVVGLLGPNGAGKTTLMKILTGYLHPTSGTARIDQLDVVEQPLAVQERIGYLPENAPIYPDMVVQEYLQMMAALRQIPEDQQLSLISQAVRRTGLQDYLVRPISQLSKGFRQRVGLAQAILHKPRVLILDEPTSGLDPTQIVEIRSLIKDLARHSTVLLSTHILSEVELTCERVLIITEGELCRDARMDDLKASNAAIVSVDGPQDDVVSALSAIPQVEGVTPSSKAEDNGHAFVTYRVNGGEADLCPRLYDVVRDRGWRLAELRADRQTLESVFRDVVDHGRVQS